jgi:hypothetical protein
MAHLVLSKSKRFVKSLKHARKCIDGALAMLPAGEGDDLAWILM